MSYTLGWVSKAVWQFEVRGECHFFDPDRIRLGDGGDSIIFPLLLPNLSADKICDIGNYGRA